jgi:Mrp family chromosome partitioning ATPase
VGKYSDTMKRMTPRADELPPSLRQRDGAVVGFEEVKDRVRMREGSAPKPVEEYRERLRPVESVNLPAESTNGSGPLVPIPVPVEVTGQIAADASIRQLSERLAPAAAVDKSCRLAIAGCRQQDGASSVAAAIAIDLSQRLSIKTLLVDANLRNPGLHRVMASGERRNSQPLIDGGMHLRNTGWSRLSLVSCNFQNDDGERESTLKKLEALLGTFSAVVIDLGVTRLDARMLPLVRPTDPILLVVRSGQTERQELVTTTAALRAADRTVAGVILNGATSDGANFFRREPGK